MPHNDLYIVDNSTEQQSVKEYLVDWCKVSKQMDIATGYLEIGGLLALDTNWQKLDKIRIILGNEMTKRTKDVIDKVVEAIVSRFNDSIDTEHERNEFLVGVPAILDAMKSGKIECRVFDKNKFHAKAYITYFRDEYRNQFIQAMNVPSGYALVGSSNFTKAGLTQNIELNVQVSSDVDQLQKWFDEHWMQGEDITTAVLTVIENHVKEFSPYDVYMRSMYEYFKSREETVSEWEQHDSVIYQGLSQYQRDGYNSMVEIANRYSGAFLCDGVGLGKTFVGMMLIERFVKKERKNVVLIVPASARVSVWETTIKKYIPEILEGFYPFKIINHTDLLLEKNENLMNQIQEQAEIVVIDEAHHFRNRSSNRYAVKKNSGINVVLGNPPYSGISSNSGEWITSMIEDYKYINGVYFGERKHWLQDDYVKFIRLGESVIDKSGHGILAFINNHAFIDNPTFRCMRWHLLNTFDEIYIIDLHGNVMKKEIAPNGDKDENVFDIQQGVSINIFVKNGTRSRGMARVYHTGIFGKRADKYDQLNALQLEKISWTALEPNEPFYFFIPRDERNRATYEKGFSIQELMPEHTTGVVTARDGLVIAKRPEVLLERIKIFTDPNKTDDQVRTYFFGNKKAGKYLPGDSRGWSLSTARKKIIGFNHINNIQKIAYRPFDIQYIYYVPEMVDWGRDKLMYHLLAGDNYALVIPRQAATDNWSHVQVTKYMADNRVHYSNKGIPIECPLYLYSPGFDGRLTRHPNLNNGIVTKLASSIGMHFVPEKSPDANTICPVDILDYIYAVLFSEKYRKAYLDFLKFDFPRIPFPQSADYFWQMVSYGSKLRELHLSEEDRFDTQYSYQGREECTVDRPTYQDGIIYFNRNGDKISNVPEIIWNMYFGGYQPLQKWLKDRKGEVLTQSDIRHFQSIITTLVATDEIMHQIDNIIIF